MVTLNADEHPAHAPLRDFNLLEAPGHLLRRCHQRSHELYNEVAEGFDLTRQQFALLLTLFQNPGASVQDLADISGTDRNTLGGVISRLEKKTLIDKARSSRDGRAYELRITQAGIDVLHAMAPAIRDLGERILSPLTAAERVEFLRYARKIAQVDGTAP